MLCCNLRKSTVFFPQQKAKPQVLIKQAYGMPYLMMSLFLFFFFLSPQKNGLNRRERKWVCMGTLWFLNPQETIAVPRLFPSATVVLVRRVEPRVSGFTESTHVL